MKIRSILATEVVVPAKAGAVNSPEVDKPLHKLESGGIPAWNRQFDELPKVLLELKLENGVVGLGECYRDVNPEILEQLAGILIGKSLQDLKRLRLPFARCREADGFECAVWDAFAKCKDVAMVDLLGGSVQDRIRVGAWSGHRVPGDLADLASRYRAMGYDCLKFKCDLKDDVAAWCREIAEAAPGMQVILDPNERWQSRPEALKRIRALESIGNLLCIEDPLPQWNLREFASLREASSLPIALHVSLPYFVHGQKISNAVRAIQEHAVDGFNFNGGIAGFQQLSLLADAAGLPCWHGSEIDLGVLEALYLHKAAAAGNCIWPSDIFGRLIREHDLLTTPLPINPPTATLPAEGPGLGVHIDRDALEHYRTREWVFGH